MAETTVFIVDDDASVRSSLQLLMRSVGLSAECYASAPEFLDAFDRERAGCLILDVRMPGMSGLELQERLETRGSTLPIIFLTAHGDVPMAVRALKAGAVDFVQKPFRDQELIEKVQWAIAEDAHARRESAERALVVERIASLTPREHEVLGLVVAGKSNKAIAAQLGVSQRTVEIHRARMMEKMEADSLAELVRVVVSVRGG